MRQVSGASARVRYTLIGVVAVAAIVSLGWMWAADEPGPMAFAKGDVVALASYKGANPTGVPAALANESAVVRGRYLARAADCEACHTAPNGKPFAGGLAIKTPFGTIYSTNITPDKQTGIGQFSHADFIRVLHRGVTPDGTHLYPAMPYTAYTYMTRADALAIKAYLFSLRPVHATAPKNTLAFPYDQRWLMAIWQALFNPGKRFEPNTDRSAEWNRGAYLTEALAHCGDCHTPRNRLQALNNRSKFSGAIEAGWRAYNITADRRTGIGAWRDAALARYLSTGHARGHGTASGPMGEAVDHSLAHLTGGDVKAIVTYLRSIPAVSSAELPATAEKPASESPKAGVPASSEVLGKQVFEGACASCHSWTGESALTPYATLTGARAVNDPSGINAAQIILSGMTRKTTNGRVKMPAYGAAYSDVEIAAVVNYVTARFGTKGSQMKAGDVSALRQHAQR
jgi:mono/diheme cytochrome c family protein